MGFEGRGMKEMVSLQGRGMKMQYKLGGREVEQADLEALVKTAKEAEQWLSRFRYNRYGIAVKDDWPDHLSLTEALRVALARFQQ
mgnify:CR=1 FL=1